MLPAVWRAETGGVALAPMRSRQGRCGYWRWIGKSILSTSSFMQQQPPVAAATAADNKQQWHLPSGATVSPGAAG